MRALLLAGSKSTRIWPLVDTYPKPLLDIGGKPIIQWIIEDMRTAGIREIIVSVGYRGDQIQDFLGRGHRFGVKIDYVVQKEPRGVADSILVAKEEFQGERPARAAGTKPQGDQDGNVDQHTVYQDQQRFSL